VFRFYHLALSSPDGIVQWNYLVTEAPVREKGSRRKAAFRLLTTVDEALETSVGLIDAAQETIRVEFYIWRDSDIGQRFLEALVRACSRGVNVRVMVDSLGSVTLQEKFFDPLKTAGGQFRWFNPLRLRRLGFRDHRKCVVCDEAIAVVGGFNIGPEYQGDGVTKGWQDIGMLAPASIARELAMSFDVLWSMADYRHHLFTRLRRSAIQRIASTPDGQLLTTAPGRGPFFMRNAIANDLRNTHHADIISAYFLPPRQLRREIVRIARRGGRVRLVLAGKSDVALSQMAAHKLYQTFLRAGVEIYEYQPQILHTKFFRFDNICYAGSANMDKRSLMINYELLVRVQDDNLAAQGLEFFERTLQHSKRIDRATWRKSRTFWNKLREQWAFWILSRVDPWLSTLQFNVLRDESKVEGWD
jgi:cardiolipin synthase